MARPRSESAVGREWEKHIRKVNDEARQVLERRKYEDNEQIRAHLSDLPFRNSVNESIAQQTTSSVAQIEDVQELDAGLYNRLHSIQDAPPAIERGGLTNTNLVELQRQVNRQETVIKGFESDLRAEQAKVRRLQAERHEAVGAYREAILVSDDGEIERWKTKVSSLLELLDQSTDRQKELERQIEEGKARERDLRDRLHCTQRRIEEPGVNSEVQEPRETPTQRRTSETPAENDGMGVSTEELQRQQQETRRWLGSMAQRQQDIEEELRSTMYAPSSRASGRSRKQAVQMEERGYISIRKASGRRGLLSF